MTRRRRLFCDIDNTREFLQGLRQPTGWFYICDAVIRGGEQLALSVQVPGNRSRIDVPAVVVGRETVGGKVGLRLRAGSNADRTLRFLELMSTAAA